MAKRDAKQEPCSHVHHWIIERNNGHNSFGRCKHCGTSVEFLNLSKNAFRTISHSAKGERGQN